MQIKRTPGVRLISFIHFAVLLAAMLVAGSGFRPANAAGVTEQIGNFETAARVETCPAPELVGEFVVTGQAYSYFECGLMAIHTITLATSQIFKPESARFLNLIKPATINGRLVFAIEKADNTQEVWSTDGTASGTGLIARFERTLFLATGFWAVRKGTALAFLANGEAGLEAWVTDGTSALARYPIPSGTAVPFQVDERGVYLSTAIDDLQIAVSQWNLDDGSTESFATHSRSQGDLQTIVSGGSVFAVERYGELFESLYRLRATLQGAVTTTTLLSALTTIDGRQPQIYAVPGGAVVLGCTTTSCGAWYSDGSPSGTRLVLDVGRNVSAGGTVSTDIVRIAFDKRFIVLTLRDRGLFRLAADGATPVASAPISSSGDTIRSNGDYYFCRGSTLQASELWLANGLTAETRKVASGCALPRGPVVNDYVYEPRLRDLEIIICAPLLPCRRDVGLIVRHLPTDRVVSISAAVSISPRFSNAAVANSGRALFQACTLVDCNVWSTDGTAGGTGLVFGQPGQAATTVMETGEDGYVYWRYKASNNQTALVRSTGTASGTRILALLGNAPTGWDSPNGSLRASVSPSGYVSLNAKTYFASCESGNAAVCGIWTSDGTVEGTRLAVPMPPDLTRSPVIVRTDDRLVFYWCQRTGCALYVSDGSPGGTHQATATTFGGVGQAWTGWKGELWTANCRQIAGAAGMAAIMSECVVQRTDGTSGMREAFRLTESDVWSTTIMRPLGDQMLVMLTGWARSKLYAWREGELPRLLSDNLPHAAGFGAAFLLDAGGSARWMFGGSVSTDGTPSGTTAICESDWARVSGAFLIGDSRCGAGSPRIWASDLNGRYRTGVFDANTTPQAFAVEQVLGIVNNRLLYEGFTAKDGTELWSIPIALDRNNADSDDDGIPDTIELVQGMNPNIKDNDIFAPTFTGARLFVMQQYRDFFAREATQAEIDFGVSAISISGRATMVQILLRSPQVLENMGPIVRLYASYFLRNPDYQGLNFWVNEYVSGRWTFPAISNFFATSPEFAARYGSLSNDQFVTLIYRNVLNREPDPDGFAFWVKQLNDFARNQATGRSAGQVMADFSESPENKQKTRALVEAVLLYAIMLKQAPDFTFADPPPTATEAISTILAKPDYRSRFLPPSP